MRYSANDFVIGQLYCRPNDETFCFRAKSSFNSSIGEEKETLFVFDLLAQSSCFWTVSLEVDIMVNGASGGTLVLANNTQIEKFKRAFSEKVTSYISRGNRIVDKCLEEFFKLYTHYHPEDLATIPHKTCSMCGKAYLKSSHRIRNVNICESCYDNNYKMCSICGDSFALNDGERTKDNSFLCSKCKKREMVLPYHRYYPNVEFYGKSNNSKIPQLFLGVELEVDEGGESNREAEKISKIINANSLFAYFSHDGSLTNGFEIITQPATLTYHNSIKHVYKEMFETLLKDGYTSHDTTTCGMHVHFNRDFYADNETVYITRLITIINKFWDDVVKFSRRNARHMTFTKKVEGSIERYIRDSNKTNNHGYHYYCINLCNDNTIELRMFRGTLNVDTFMATLQFVNNCIVAAKEKSDVEIDKMTFDELITGRNLKSYWKSRSQMFYNEC